MGEEEEKKQTTTPQSDSTSVNDNSNTDQNQQQGGDDNPGTGNAKANTNVSDQSQQQGGDDNPGTGGTGQPTTDQNQQAGGQNNPASMQVDPSSLGSLTDPTAGLLNQPPKLGFHIGPNGETIYDTAEEAWNHGQSISDYAKTSNDSIGDVLSSYWNWANQNDKPIDIINVMGAMQGQDITKSAAQNAAEEKKAKRQQMWDSLGLVLTHLGNFAGTLAGGPAQKIEAPEFSKRQQALYDATMQQRDKNNQNLLTQLWNQQANERKNDLAKAQEKLYGAKQDTEAARKAGIEGDTANKKAVADANVGNIAAQQKQHEAQTEAINNKDKREEALAPLVRERVQAQTRASNASADASEASAAHSRAATRATNEQAYGKRYEKDRYRIWARNRRLHPNESRDFMQQNNIHSWDKKNWNKELIDQYNGYIADKFSGRKKSSGSASSLLD